MTPQDAANHLLCKIMGGMIPHPAQQQGMLCALSRSLRCNQRGMRHPDAEPLAMCPRGQSEGNYDSDRFRIRTLRYSLRRVSPLDSVNCGSHNPKVGGSNPPHATKKIFPFSEFCEPRNHPN